jgi:hypothetical protein
VVVRHQDPAAPRCPSYPNLARPRIEWARRLPHVTRP